VTSWQPRAAIVAGVRMAWHVGLLSCALAACSFTDPRVNCDSDAACRSGQHCYRQFCVPDEQDHTAGQAGRTGGAPSNAAGGRDGTTGELGNAVRGDAAAAASVDAGSDAAVGGGVAGAAGETHASGSGGAAGDTGGAGAGGTAAAAGARGDTAGASGTGAMCQDGAMRDCSIEALQSGPADRCRMGSQRCTKGAFGPCEPKVQPSVELCNGQDDDCDGQTDEQTESTCYSGPSGTLKVGKCAAGSQICKNGALAACAGEVLPQPESCANEGADDNCDAVQDNIPARGNMCLVNTNMGACQNGTLQCQASKPDLVCVTRAPSVELCNVQDDDCDGKVDEAFDLLTDATNCGACGKACATKESCCAGRCVNTQSDVNHCGMCGRACVAGARPGCCTGSCADLLSDGNCGACGHACGLLGGVACSCGMMGAGAVCTAPLGLCP
jgi:hypothetical protein